MLDFTQRVRRDLIADMTRNGIPDENKDRATLLAALGDIDTQELNKAKIDAKSASTDVERQGLEIFQRLLNGEARMVNPFQRQAIEGEVEHTRTLPSLPAAVDLVPGETDLGISDMNLPEFAKRAGMRMDTIAGMSSGVNEEFAPKDDELPSLDE